MPHYQCLTTPFPERWTGREGLAWLTGDEMDDMNPITGQSINNYAICFIAYPVACAQPSAKANGKGTALKGQRPYPEKEKAALFNWFSNTQPTLSYAVPLPSAAFR
jgi:hypothetical protein